MDLDAEKSPAEEAGDLLYLLATVIAPDYNLSYGRYRKRI
jgi:hypothetical protein